MAKNLFEPLVLNEISSNFVYSKKIYVHQFWESFIHAPEL